MKTALRVEGEITQDGHLLVVLPPALPIGRVAVTLQPLPAKLRPTPRPRRFGLDQGKIVIRDDFDEPLPELEKEFYGSPDDPA